jgi:NAD+ diphosphatase
VPSSFVPGLDAGGPARPDGLCFAIRRGEVLVIEDGGGAAVPPLADLGGIDRPHFLGKLGEVDCYAVSLTEEAAAPPGMAFQPLRPLASLLDEALFRIAGRAVQIVEWEETHRFCGRCGTATEPSPGERAKRCSACGLLAFPRVAPAVIVRVTRGEKILLARNRRFPQPIYSVLAGFVEPGESLEEAVVREIREEAGIEIDELAYFGSQPWPFPHSLMVAFTARYGRGELRIDADELLDAGWFRAAAMPRIPPPFSIARRLIDDWTDVRRP